MQHCMCIFAFVLVLSSPLFFISLSSFSLFYILVLPASQNTWRAQSIPPIPSFTSSPSSSSSCFPPILPSPPAPSQYTTSPVSVGEPANSPTRPTSLPSSTDTGIGREGELAPFQFIPVRMALLECLLLSFCVVFSPLFIQLPG